MRRQLGSVVLLALTTVGAVHAQTLVGLAIEGAGELLPGQSADYLVQAVFSDGRTFEATLCSGLSVDPPELAAVSPFGRVVATPVNMDAEFTLRAVFTFDQMALEASRVIEIAAVSCPAPAFSNVRATGGTGVDEPRRIRVLEDGSRYVVGSFSNTVDFDPSDEGVDTRTSSGLTDGFVTKFSPVGMYEWTRTWGGIGADYCADVAISPDGEAYVLGVFTRSIDLNPDPNEAHVVAVDPNGPATRSDVFLVKLGNDPNLAYAWGVTLGGQYDDVAWQLVATQTGGCAVVGKFQGRVDFDPDPDGFDWRRSTITDSTSDFFVWRLDSSGHEVWAFTKGGNANEQATAIVEAPDGTLYVAGEFFSGQMLVDPGPPAIVLAAGGGSDAFMLKLTPAGAVLNACSWGSISTETAADLKLAPNGDLVVVGDFWGTVDFNPDLAPDAVEYRASAGQQDAYMLRLSPHLEYRAVSTIGGAQTDGALGVDVAIDNRVIVVGYFVQSMTLQSASGPIVLTALGGEDIYVAKYAPLGTLNWAVRLGGTQSERARGIETLGIDDLLISGHFRGVCDFDPDAEGEALLTSNGESDVFLLRLLCEGGQLQCMGDVNCDWLVDFFDIDPFVGRIGCPNVRDCDDECPWENADIDGSGLVDFFDIDPFVARIGDFCPR